jgi:iron complex transport system permease protein
MTKRPVLLGLAAAAVALIALQVGIGVDSGIAVAPADALRACLALVGLAEPLPGYSQDVITWRLWRALTAAGVGGCLALAGTLLQGLFRNPLASPSLIGVTAGANLGATAALLALGGYGAALELADSVSAAPYLVTLAAFVGSLTVAMIVVAIATRTGPGATSVATILLLGVALNSCIAGTLSAVENVLMDARDYGTLNALQAWSFGTLDDRKAYHAVLVGLGVAIGAAAIPFVGRELDLLTGGDDDAESLGVPILRTRIVALTVAALATACAVAAAGQVGFVGLVVPHLLRLLVGSSHRTLLPLSLLGGAVFVLGTDLAQVLVIGERPLRAGVLMSLLGGPFFLVLLVVHSRRRIGW